MTTLSRRQRPPYRGLDYQGRHPAAEDATEGVNYEDDPLNPGYIFLLAIGALAAWLIVILAVLSAWWPA